LVDALTDAPTLIRFHIENGRPARHNGTASDVTIRGVLGGAAVPLLALIRRMVGS